MLHLCCSAHTGKLSAKFIEANIRPVNDLVICLYSIVFVDTYAKRTMFTIIVFSTLQESWDVPAVPLRSALAVLIENQLHEGRKARNGSFRIVDPGLGSA